MADPSAKFMRELVTPEGVALNLKLATAGSRAAAFAIDAAIMIGVLLLVTAAAAMLVVGRLQNLGIAAIIWLLGFFLLRNFYFTIFESGVRAATPGKRLTKLRVVARDGGQLTGAAVLARNLMREVEIFLPIIFLISAQAEGFSNRWLAIFGLIWTGIFLFMPLFNRDRLRAGDMLAGTWVVENERPKIAPDLIARADPLAERYSFTAGELDTYGQFEIQRLEDVLHRNDPDTIVTVAGIIRRKLGRADGRHYGSDDREFLDAFYTAARLHLEKRLLFGQRKRDKFDSGS